MLSAPNYVVSLHNVHYHSAARRVARHDSEHARAAEGEQDELQIVQERYPVATGHLEVEQDYVIRSGIDYALWSGTCEPALRTRQSCETAGLRGHMSFSAVRVTDVH